MPERTTTRTRTHTTDLPPTVSSEPLDYDPFREGNTVGSDPESLGISPNVGGKSKAETELILKALSKTYASIAVFVSIVSFDDARVIGSNLDDMVESWRTLLDEDAKLRKRMLALTKASGWGAVVAAHLPVAVAISMNHKDKLGHLIKPRSTDETVES